MLGTQKSLQIFFFKKIPELLRWLVVIGATLLSHGYIADTTFINVKFLVSKDLLTFFSQGYYEEQNFNMLFHIIVTYFHVLLYIDY